MKLLRIERVRGKVYLHVHDGIELFYAIRACGLNVGMIWNPYHDVIIVN
jgi:hypothetical protein